MSKEISLQDLKNYRDNYNANKYTKLAGNAVQKNGVLASAFNSEEAVKLPCTFNVEVKDMPSVTAQKQTGRCWMFSSLNVLRPTLAKNLGVKDIELSESYLFFYDKLEKCNFKLQSIIDHIEEPDDSRILDGFMGVGGDFDGGYWHYFRDLVKKYGICPKSVMTDSVPANASKEMDSVLNMLLAKDVNELRTGYRAGKTVDDLQTMKNEMLNDIYRVLGICLGLPVEKFVYEYRKDNDEKEFVRIETTPKEFYEKYIGLNLDDYVVMAHHENKDYPFYEKYQNCTSKDMYNQNYFILNLPLQEMKESAIKALKDNQPLFFACDVLSYSIRQEGLLSRKVNDIDSLFSIDLTNNKFNRVVYHGSFWNHAMTLTGVNLDDNGQPNRWKVQNSWGTEVGTKGIFVMDDDWFDQFVYQVMVDKKYLSEKALAALDKEIKVLDSWIVIA